MTQVATTTRLSQHVGLEICDPIDGIGACGLDAPHAMLGRTQQAILDHKTRRAAHG